MKGFDGSPNMACAMPDKIRPERERLLREHLDYCIERSPFYRQRLRAAGVVPSSVTLNTIASLPLTGKSEFAAHNEDFLAVPGSAIVDIVQSSGTTGAPTKIMYTEHDLARLAYNERRSFEACGVTGDDVALLTCTMDRCFVAGLAYFVGLRSLGAAVIRNGNAPMASHLDIIGRLRPTVIVGVPSFLRKLGQFMRQEGAEPADTCVGKLVCIGEPLRDSALRLLPSGRELQEMWAARAFSTYASTETVSTFCECTAQQGGHILPELAVAEIVDPEGSPVPDGEVGEVVVTPLRVEGMPLVRFRTGDLSFLMREPCSCGRCSARIGPIVGRKAQMLKLRGTTIYPPAVHALLDEMPMVQDYYISVTSGSELSDEVVVHVCVDEAGISAEDVQERLQSRLRVKPSVVIEPREEVARHVYTPLSRKPVRFVDLRTAQGTEHEATTNAGG